MPLDPAPSERSSAEPPLAVRPPPIAFAAALAFWFKLGFVSFGGPAGQISLMHTELVERRRWISEKRFLHALNFCMVLPGPEAQQLATYIGWLMHRTAGGLAAGLLFVLPSFVLLIVLAWVYLVFGTLPLVAGIFFGLKPAVTALVLHAAWRIGSRTLKHAFLMAIAAAAFVAIFSGDAPFPAIVIVAGAIGWVGSRVAPAVFEGGHAKSTNGVPHAPAWIDDDTPTPPHARHSRRGALRVLGLGLALWSGGMALLVAQSGFDGALAAMGWFFTKAALLTFGGAYAVLPYVFQGAVEQHHWLSAAQMIDGLALGETTPGPLIMVVTFVGFIGGWTTRVFGAEAPFAAAVAGATVATVFTFLPSFVFILAGGPLIESTHGQRRFTAPLTAITAAVVGVIVSLAAFFALHVFWPRGFGGGIDAVSVGIALLAALALFRFKVGVIPLLAACAAAGALYTVVWHGAAG